MPNAGYSVVMRSGNTHIILHLPTVPVQQLHLLKLQNEISIVLVKTEIQTGFDAFFSFLY